MAAPKHNTYWKQRAVHGRKKEFPTPEDLHQAWADYFTWSDKNPWYRTEQLKKPQVVKKDGNETLVTTIEIPTKRPYTESGFCAFHGLGKNYITQLEEQLSAKKPEERTAVDDEYSGILAWARNICWTDKFEGAAVGAYNVSIISRDLGLRDEQGVKLSGDKENPIQTENKVHVIKSTLKLT